MTIESTARRNLLLAIAATLGCAGYVEEVDVEEPYTPARDVLVVPDATSPPKAATPPSRCPPGTRELLALEGSCGFVECEPIVAEPRRK